jgi:MYXO-CTERM domain-containing protein
MSTNIGLALLLLGSLLMPAAAFAAPLDAEQADRLRIQQHLAQVEQQLRRVPVDALSPSARLSRARLLDELHRYWQAGVFPRNSQHVGERRPYFIDDEGRPCAVGELVIRSGSATLAERIDRNFHTEYVPDIHDAELLAWAETNGFSVAELALIQPTYCNCDGTSGAGTGAAAAGAGGVDGADYFQPVCASNGLTYWNQCIAELCGGVTIVSTGKCEREPPCELCGTGIREAVVSDCGRTGICNGIDSQPDVVGVKQAMAARWLALQQAGCQNPDYGDQPTRFCPDFDSDAWQPACSSESWMCWGNGGTAGPPNADDPSRVEPVSDAVPSGGCSCSAAPFDTESGVALSLLLIGLAGLRRRAR